MPDSHGKELLLTPCPAMSWGGERSMLPASEGFCKFRPGGWETHCQVLILLLRVSCIKLPACIMQDLHELRLLPPAYKGSSCRGNRYPLFRKKTPLPAPNMKWLAEHLKLQGSEVFPSNGSRLCDSLDVSIHETLEAL